MLRESQPPVLRVSTRHLTQIRIAGINPTQLLPRRVTSRLLRAGLNAKGTTLPIQAAARLIPKMRALARRKAVGGLHLAIHRSDGFGPTPPRSPSPLSSRQIQPDRRNFPKHKKQDPEGPRRLQPSTLDKLITGIWEQLHNPPFLLLDSQWQ
jgi:hypothetical protein